MPGAGDIRAGRAYVEMGLDQKSLDLGLAIAQNKLNRFSADGGGVAPPVNFGRAADILGADSESAVGGIRWASRLAHGAGMVYLAHELGGAMKALAVTLKGEYQNVGDVLGRVPVLGPAILSLGEGFDDLFLGWRANVEKFKDEVKKFAEGLKGIFAVGALAEGITIKVKLAGMDPFEREIAEAEDEARASQAKITKNAFLGGVPLNDPAVLANRKKVQEALDATITDIRTRSAGAAEKQRKNVQSILGNAMDRATQAGMSPGDAARAEAEAESRRLAANTPGFTEERRVEWLQWTLQGIKAKEDEADAEAEYAEACRQTDEWLKAQLADANQIADAVVRNAEEMVRQAEALEAAARTPEQVARDSLDRLKELQDAGLLSPEAYVAGTRKALKDAASMIPDTIQTTIGAQGSFSAFDAAAGNVSGLSEQIAEATKETAKNTAKMTDLLARLGQTYQ